MTGRYSPAKKAASYLIPSTRFPWAQLRVALAIIAVLVIVVQILGARQYIYEGERRHHSGDLGDTVIYGLGDTYEVVEFTRAALTCLAKGQWTGCREAGRFALLQHIPAAAWVTMGYTTGHVMRFLGELNLLSLWILIIATAAFFGRRRMLETLLFVLLIVTSPLLVYARSSFGEMIAAVLASLFCLSVMTRQHWWVTAGLGLLVGATKDIAAPFVALLGLAALGPTLVLEPGRLRLQVVGVVAAGVVAILPNAAFNYFRFGTVFNNAYLSMLPAPSLPTSGSYLLALLVAPNFGMLFFWPTLCAFVGTLAVTLWRRHQPRPLASFRSLAPWFPFLAAVGVIIGLSLGLSRTGYATAGFSWPPRYLLPWCPAVLLILLHHYGAATRDMLAGVVSRPVFIGAIALICVGGLPNLAVNFRPHRLSAVSNLPFEPGCPRLNWPWNAPAEEVQYYYDCEHYRKWRPQRSTQLEALKVVTGVTGDRSYVISVVAYAALVTVLCLEIRRRVLVRPTSAS
jgi:hypothetical protein